MPEENCITETSIGYRGAWGTTYASDLRQFADTLSVDAFVEVLHTRIALLPTPWMYVHELSERDARALYAYLQHLGPKGKSLPENVPPGREPTTPYIVMTPQNTAAHAPADSSTGSQH